MQTCSENDVVKFSRFEAIEKIKVCKFDLEYGNQLHWSMAEKLHTWRQMWLAISC